MFHMLKWCVSRVDLDIHDVLWIMFCAYKWIDNACHHAIFIYIYFLGETLNYTIDLSIIQCLTLDLSS